MQNHNLIRNDLMDVQLRAFGINSDQLASLLYDTSAVMAGGSVVHYLHNVFGGGEVTEAPATSDLDFWIYLPSRSSNIHHMLRAFTSLVEERFRKTFPDFHPIDPPHPAFDKKYADMGCMFTASGGTNMSVRWWQHATNGNLINIIYVSKPPADAVALFDIPLCRSLIYGLHGKLWGDWPKVAVADITEKRLTRPPVYDAPARNVETRLEKYCARYGLKQRGSILLSVVSEFGADLPEILIDYSASVNDLHLQICKSVGASAERWRLRLGSSSSSRSSQGSIDMDPSRHLADYNLRNHDKITLCRK